MRKLDRLGWAAALSFTAYGLRVGVRVNDARALALLAGRLPPGSKPSPAPLVERLYSLRVARQSARPGVRHFNLLYGDITRLARTAESGAALDALESDLKMFVAEFARRRIFVHAGAVGWKGRAVVIPGASMSGKTTLVAELVKAGADYYSDEYAVLDASGRVHPYPQPLQVREGPGARQSKVPVETFGGRTGTRPLAVGLVVAARYSEGAAWRARRLSAGQGVLELLANTVAARRRPAAALSALRRAVEGAPALKAVRGDAARAAERILRLLEGEEVEG